MCVCVLLHLRILLWCYNTSSCVYIHVRSTSIVVYNNCNYYTPAIFFTSTRVVLCEMNLHDNRCIRVSLETRSWKRTIMRGVLPPALCFYPYMCPLHVRCHAHWRIISSFSMLFKISCTIFSRNYITIDKFTNFNLCVHTVHFMIVFPFTLSDGGWQCWNEST